MAFFYLFMPLTLYWIRQDLRLFDNSALTWAAKQGQVLPFYILDDDEADALQRGALHKTWLLHSIKALNRQFKGKLFVFQGDAQKIIEKLIKKFSPTALCWNCSYEPWRVKRDEHLQSFFSKTLRVKTLKANLLWEPREIVQEDGAPFTTFASFYLKARQKRPQQPLPYPPALQLVDVPPEQSGLKTLKLFAEKFWTKNLEHQWTPGEEGGRAFLLCFLESKLRGHANEAPFPSQAYVSRLSPHLHFGEISPHNVFHAVMAKREVFPEDADYFLRELAWREFSYYLLHYFPDFPTKNIQKKFDAYPWHECKYFFSRWKEGRTGFPFVDAGMRELKETGYMHKYVRRVVASFLVKNLCVHWRKGAEWFMETLVDADIANNSVSWQRVAGTGIDPFPFPHILNPVTQGRDLDPQGEYIYKFLPALKKLPPKYLFAPFQAPQTVLKDAGIFWGKTYYLPCVDLTTSHKAALDAFYKL